VISTVKLIAEPWDVGEGGYQVGNFPVLWAEWNGKYRDTARKFWRGDESQLGELAFRLTGSSDLYQGDGRHPTASVNFVTAHDGFTLADLVSYDEKHNEANGEDNRDGADDNHSWNCGAEGPTDDPRIAALRARQQRNFLAMLLVSQGVPMLLGGDEIGRTQGGNNNAYCQDNAVSWFDWELDRPQHELLEFTRAMIRLRAAHPNLRRRKWFQGRAIHGPTVSDIFWVRPDGKEMTEEEWQTGWLRTLGLLLPGDAIALVEVDEDGRPIKDETLLILLNAHSERVDFLLPSVRPRGGRWEVLVDTDLAASGKSPAGKRRRAGPAGPDRSARVASARDAAAGPIGDEYPLAGHSLAVLRYVA
jgi:glycogen operon protein